MSKKSKITISLDAELLEKIDEYVVEQQKKNLEEKKALTNRSKEIETIISNFI